MEFKVIDIVKNNVSKFSSYRKNVLYYTIDFEGKTYQFTIPIEDCGDGTFDKEMKAITTMRWIRKAIENNEFICIT